MTFQRFLVSLSTWIVGFALTCPVQAGERLSLQSLTVEETQTFVNCKRNFFDGDVCKRLVNKLCTVPENTEVWQCLENSWANCQNSDFSSPECQKTVTKVCSLTQNNYDYVCDRTRYETCLQSEFREQGCQDYRISFTLPILKRDIEKQEKSEKTRPAGLTNQYCSLAAQDPSSPLDAACKGQTLTLDDLLLVYSRLKKTDVKAVIRAFQNFAAGQKSADSLFNAIDLTMIWMEVAEKTEGKSGDDLLLRRTVAQSFAQAGSDDLLGTFLLIEMSADEDALIRAAAMKGLSLRTYRTSLALTTLLKGLTDEAESVRIEAIQGVSQRWLLDAQSVLATVDPTTKLRILVDCNAVHVDPNFYQKISTVDDLKNIDMGAPEVLCAIGKAANLTRLKNDIASRWISLIQSENASSNERVTAAKALPGLIVSPQEWPSFFDKLKQMLNHGNRILAGAVLESLVRILPNKVAGDEDAPQSITDKFAQPLAAHLRFLFSSGPADDAALKELFQLLLYKGLLQTYESLRVPNLYRLTMEECIAKPGITLLRRLNCYAGLVPSSPEAEVLVWPVARDVLKRGSYAERKRLSELLSSNSFGFQLPQDRGLACQELSELVNELNRSIVRIVEQPVGTEISALDHLGSTLDFLLSPYQVWMESCSELQDKRRALIQSLKRPQTLNRMQVIVEANFPKLPMKSWYDEFASSKKDVIEIARIPSEVTVNPEVHLQRSYTTRKDIADDKIPKLFPVRTLDMVIVHDFAWEPYKKLLAESLNWDLKKDLDSQFEQLFWGISTPQTKK